MISPEDRDKSIREVCAEEQSRLIALSEQPCPCDEREEVRVPKTPYDQFDLNDYSLPADQVKKNLTVNLALDTVSILDPIFRCATKD